MSMRHVRHLRRAGAATLLAAVLAFSATACGGDDGGNKPSDNASNSSPGKGSDQGQDGGGTVPDKSKTIATLNGQDGVQMVIYSAKRDSGGFLTVQGEIKNTGGVGYTTPIQWSGEETAVAGTGRSLAGMTLVDSVGKKRYYVLRDTDNRPLTTTGFDPLIAADSSLVFFAQFPAPPQSTTSVDLQFPTFPDASIEISS